MTAVPVRNALGIVAWADIEPRLVDASTPSRHIVRVVIERGCEALSGRHLSQTANGMVSFDGADSWERPFVPDDARRAPSRLRRELPVVECAVAPKPGLGAGADLTEEVFVRVEATTGPPSRQTVGPAEPAVLPVVVRP